LSQLNKLYRNFIILQEDERGYSSSNDKTLSGYSKIEAKGDKCKITFYAQNLRSDSNDYHALAICNKKDNKKILDLGNIMVSDGGKAELTKEYLIDDIGGIGLSYDKISGVAVAKMKDDIPIIIMCGFINGEEPKDNWKNYKIEKDSCGKSKMEYKKKDSKKKKDKKREEDKASEGKPLSVSKTTIKDSEDRKEVNLPNKDKPTNNISTEAKSTTITTTPRETTPTGVVPTGTTPTGTVPTGTTPTGVNEFISSIGGTVVDTNQDGVADTVCIPYGTMVDMMETAPFGTTHAGAAPAPGPGMTNMNSAPNFNIQGGQMPMPYGYNHRLETDGDNPFNSDNYENPFASVENMDTPFYNKRSKEYEANPFDDKFYEENPFNTRYNEETNFINNKKKDKFDDVGLNEDNDYLSIRNRSRIAATGKTRSKFDEYENQIEELSNSFKIRGSVGEYFETIARGFEAIKDGPREIKYCKWYEVPVSDLNDLCNMSNYNRYTVAYYPMLNYYPYIRKHGRFLLGYKCDRDGNLKYIVYGIPGGKNIEDQPYEGKTGFVTWAKDKQRDGMGYWLMFYDFRNSIVVVPMEQ